MSFLRWLLDTTEAKEAIGAGVVQLIVTGNLDRGIDAMIEKGNKNGSWPAAKLAFILDLFGLGQKY